MNRRKFLTTIAITVGGVAVGAVGIKDFLNAPLSALDNVGTRRLALYVQKAIDRLCNSYKFEPNDAVTWRNFTYNMNLFMDDLVKRKAIEDYRVTCDETTNTPDKIEKNAFCGRVFIKRKMMAEYLQLSFIMCEDSSVEFDNIVVA